jgi:hypothetical protein
MADSNSHSLGIADLLQRYLAAFQARISHPVLGSEHLRIAFQHSHAAGVTPL